MQEQDDIEIRLWEYIDGICTDAGQTAVAQLIATNPQWKAKYEELLALNTTILNTLETEEPSIRFTKNVMDTIANTHVAPAINGYINPFIIKGIAAFFVVAILLVTGYALSSANWTAAADTLPKITLPKMALPQVNISEYVNSTVIYIATGINLMLALLFTDAMLRKTNKKKQHQ